MKPSLIIFDLDGTLIDSIHGIAYIINAVLEKNGFPARAFEEFYEIVGHGLRHSLVGALPKDFSEEHLIQKMLDEAHEFYEANPTVNTRFYPEIEKMLIELEGMGIPYAVNTNKPASISGNSARG